MFTHVHPLRLKICMPPLMLRTEQDAALSLAFAGPWFSSAIRCIEYINAGQTSFVARVSDFIVWGTTDDWKKEPLHDMRVWCAEENCQHKFRP